MIPNRVRVCLFAVLASTTLVAGQLLPSCASLCVGKISGCSSVDYACMCTNKAFLDKSVCCLHENCSDSDRETTEEYSRTLCIDAGYIIPSGVTCSSIASSATGTSRNSQSHETGDSSIETSSPASSDDDDSGSGGSSSNFYKKKKSKTTLRTGLGAGLGVGVPLLAALVGGLAFLRRRSKRKQQQMPPVQKIPVPGQGPPFQGQPQVNQSPPNYGYPPQVPQQQAVSYQKTESEMMGNTPSPIVQVNPVYQQQTELMGSTPSHLAQVNPAYQQQTELMGSTPSPLHELPNHNTQYGSQQNQHNQPY